MTFAEGVPVLQKRIDFWIIECPKKCQGSSLGNVVSSHDLFTADDLLDKVLLDDCC